MFFPFKPYYRTASFKFYERFHKILTYKLIYNIY